MNNSNTKARIHDEVYQVGMRLNYIFLQLVGNHLSSRENIIAWRPWSIWQSQENYANTV